MSVFGAGPKRVLTIPANGLSRAHSRRERQPPASAHTPDVLIAPTGVVKEDFPIAVALNNRKSVQRTATLCNHLGQRWRTLCGREVGPATGGLRRRRSCKIPPAVGRRGWRVCWKAPAPHEEAADGSAAGGRCACFNETLGGRDAGENARSGAPVSIRGGLGLYARISMD